MITRTFEEWIDELAASWINGNCSQVYSEIRRLSQPKAMAVSAALATKLQTEDFANLLKIRCDEECGIIRTIPHPVA